MSGTITVAFMASAAPCPGQTLSGDPCENTIARGRVTADGTCGQCKGSRVSSGPPTHSPSSLDNASLVDAPFGDGDTTPDDAIDRAVQFVLTEATCGASCWEAREDVCRCSCGGRNHGLAKQGGRGPRTCKAGRARYELVAVVAESEKPYQMAAEMSEEATGERQRGNFSIRPNWGPQPLFAVQPSTKAQQKWPEVGQAFAGWDERKLGEAPIDRHRRRPHLIWKRIE